MDDIAVESVAQFLFQPEFPVSGVHPPSGWTEDVDSNVGSLPPSPVRLGLDMSLQQRIIHAKAMVEQFNRQL